MMAIHRGNVVRKAATEPMFNVAKKMTETSAEKSQSRLRKYTIARKIPKHMVLFMVTAP